MKYILTRFAKGYDYRHPLGVFDTKEDAEKYQHACERLHIPDIWVYVIDPVKHNPTWS